MDKFKVGDKIIYVLNEAEKYTVVKVEADRYYVDYKGLYNMSYHFTKENEVFFELEEKYRKIQQFKKEMDEIINPKNRAYRRNYKPNELLTGEIYEKKQRNTSRRY